MLKSAINNLEITRIVSIDDDYVCQSESDNTLLDNFLEIEIITDEDFQYCQDIGINTVGELLIEKNKNDEKINEIIQKVQTVNSSENSSTALNILENVVKDLFDSNLEFKKINNYNAIKDLSKENTIWILDKEMKTVDNAIAQEINIIQNKNIEKTNIYVIYTSDASLCELNSEWQKRFDFLKNEGLDDEEILKLVSYQLFVIKKEDNKTKLQRELQKGLINSIRGFLVYDMISNMKNISDICHEKLIEISKDLNAQNYSRLRYNFENEGAHNLIEILYNILCATEKEGFFELMQSKSNHIFAFKNIIEHGGDILSEGEINKKTVDTLMKNPSYQYYFFDKSINCILDDIQFGDIFKIRLSQSYKEMIGLPEKIIGIVFSQSCDCIIRKKNKKRKTIAFELGIFELKEINKDHKEINKDHKEFLQTGVPIYDENKFIDLNECLIRIVIPEALLDLCTFDKYGRCRVLKKEDIENLIMKKTGVWKGRNTDYLLSKNILKLNVKDIDPLVEEEIISEKYKIKFDSENQYFHLQRIGRLNENIAYAALHYTYMKNLRIGRNPIDTLEYE